LPRCGETAVSQVGAASDENPQFSKIMGASPKEIVGDGDYWLNLKNKNWNIFGT